MLPFVIIGLMNCYSTDPQVDADAPTTSVLAAEKFKFRYELNKPDRTMELPGKLDEISGLGMSTYKTLLCAIQDEKGIVFFVDKKSGKIREEVQFWKDGDYEGVEVVGDDVFVVKSTGTVYEIRKLATSQQEVLKYNSFLGRENDVEGLCYDEKNQRLLLACKGKPATGESLETLRFKKVIYSFDLKSKALDPEPAYSITLDQIQAYLKRHPNIEKRDKFMEYFAPDKSNLDFNPSAIAIHPKTGNLYLTSSVGKVIMVLSPKGKLLYIGKLEKKIHPQPEGIVFDDDGGMYISNEGKNGKARIHYFKAQANRMKDN